MKIVLLITLALLLSLLFTLDFATLGNAFGNINLFFLILSLFLVILEISLKSIRLRVLISSITKIPFPTAFLATLVGFPFATVTPGRVGDLIKVYTLSRKTSLPLQKSFAVGIFEKILDLISLFLLVTSGIAILALQGIIAIQLLYLLLAIAFISFLVIAAFPKKLINVFLKYAFVKLIPLKYRDHTETAFDNFYSALSDIWKHKKNLGQVLALAVFLWANRMLLVLLFALALGIEVQWKYFFFIIPITFAAEILPVSVMGLGTREYTFILLFSLVGINKEAAVAISLLVFMFGILPPAVIGYFVALKEYGGMGNIKKVMNP